MEHDIFENIFQKKRKLKKQIENAKFVLGKRSSVDLKEKCQALRKELEAVLFQEEILWFQKSRSKWINFGDKNSHFFHTSTVIRRRSNKIVVLQDSNKDWVTDDASLQHMAVRYFRNLYSDETNSFSPLFVCCRVSRELVQWIILLSFKV